MYFAGGLAKFLLVFLPLCVLGDERYGKCVTLGLQKISKFNYEDFQTFAHAFSETIYKWLSVVDSEW